MSTYNLTNIIFIFNTRLSTTKRLPIYGIAYVRYRSNAPVYINNTHCKC